jgi:hypothetical protein
LSSVTHSYLPPFIQSRLNERLLRRLARQTTLRQLLFYAEYGGWCELTAEEKFLNRIISGFRILVENVIARVKRCRIVKNVFRNTKEGFSDSAIEVACGLHNLRVACCHPVPTLNLLDLCT